MSLNCTDEYKETLEEFLVKAVKIVNNNKLEVSVCGQYFIDNFIKPLFREILPHDYLVWGKNDIILIILSIQKMAMLTKDMWQYIADKLCYVDQYALRCVCKRTAKIKLDFKAIILERLSRLVDDPEKFCEMLYQTDTILTGSFILACLYNTDNFKDLDTYSNKFDKQYINDWSQYLYSKYPYDSKIYENVYMIRDFHLPTTTLQHIYIWLPPKQYIDYTFDLDISKSHFNGRKLYIKSWSKLLRRCDLIKPNGLLMKYYSQTVDVESLSKKRMKKYINYGFDIQFHPQYNDIKAMIENKIDEYQQIGIDPKYKYVFDKGCRLWKQTDDFCVDLSIY